MRYRTHLHVGPVTRGLHDLTARLNQAVRDSGVDEGLCHLWLHHTSASLVVQENADPAVLVDLEAWMSRLVRDGDPAYTHTEEGPDDMAGHLRAALTVTSLTIPVALGRLDLGTWQAVYLWEHRVAPHTRRLTVSVTA